MPSWERLQEGSEEPFTDDIDADILLSDGRPSHLSTLASYGQTLRRFFRSGNRAWILLFIATLVVIPLVPIILLVYSHRVSLSSSSTRNLHPNHLPVVNFESTTPFLESFDFDNTSEVSLRSFSPPEFSPIFDFLYDYLNLLESGDAEVSNTTNSSTTPLEVTVFYEVLDIPSRLFLTHHFFPTYFNDHKLKPGNRELVAKLVPYGHAQLITDPLTKQDKVTCEHGKDECQGNLVHACAIRHTKWNDTESVDWLMNYIECMIEDTGKGGEILKKDADAIGKTCAQLHQQINWEQIHNCTQTSEGQIILRTFQKNTDFVLKGNTKGSTTLPLVYVKGYGVLSETERNDFQQFILTRLGIQ